MSKELRQGKIMVGDTQIGNSPVIYGIDDNVWEEDLGHVYVKYSYDKNGKDLIVEWENRG
jgi:hypothetical protein